MSVTSVRIDDDLSESLEEVSHDVRRSKGWIINEALRLYFNHINTEDQRWRDTLEALDDIKAGRTVDAKNVHAWLRSWGTSKVKPTPKK